MDAFLLQQSLFDPQELPIPPRMGSEKTWQLDNGYVYEFAPDHLAADLHGRVLQHRLVMEWKLGRLLEPEEIVHHRNLVKSDNSPDNLEVFANNVEHLRSHAKRRDPALIEAVRIAAADPKVPMHSLPASSVLVRLICKENNIEWISADKTHLTDEKVLQAIQLHPGLSVYKIAEILGVAGSHLYLNYSHLFVKRKPPGYLDQFREEICKSAIALYGQEALGHGRKGHQTVRTLANQYGVSCPTVYIAFERWSKAGVLPTELAVRLNADPRRKNQL